jgi:hypothetical protein
MGIGLLSRGLKIKTVAPGKLLDRHGVAVEALAALLHVFAFQADASVVPVKISGGEAVGQGFGGQLGHAPALEQGQAVLEAAYLHFAPGWHGHGAHSITASMKAWAAFALIALP